MNVLSAFTFGSLIKTFLPGLVWLIAILVLVDDLASVAFGFTHAEAIIAAHEQSMLVLAIPAAILLGLISNIVVFMGINDWLVRSPFRRTDAELHALHIALCQSLRKVYWRRVAEYGGAEARFHEHIDTEMLVLPLIGVANLAYVREQYWYHLEFQVNLLFAIVALLATILGSPHVYDFPRWELALRAGTAVACLGGTSWVLLRAAKKNYRRHIAKMCSLMAAALYTEAKEPPTSEPRPGLGVSGSSAWLPGAWLLAGLACGAFLTSGVVRARSDPRR